MHNERIVIRGGLRWRLLDGSFRLLLLNCLLERIREVL